jgi:DNA-binding NarL/FixJ family response regulator
VTAAPRLLLAEADAPTRAGLRMSLAAAGFEVVAEADEHGAAVNAALEQRPDVMLVAAELPGGGIEAAGSVAERLPGVKIVVLSDRPSGAQLVEAVLAGAAGYLGKAMSLERLPHAVRGVLDGEVALPRRHMLRLLEELRGRDMDRTVLASRTNAALTDREWQVLRLLGDGDSTGQIARRLGISDVTVRRHVSSLLAKLAVPDRRAAAALLRRSPD